VPAELLVKGPVILVSSEVGPTFLYLLDIEFFVTKTHATHDYLGILLICSKLVVCNIFKLPACNTR
jgi:hypothetical protein